MNKAFENIQSLQALMENEGISHVLMTSSDYHMSEYVGDFFKVTEFFSGCTSDNVVMVVSLRAAKLWTDGRFFISAAAELAGSGIELMKMGEPGVPTVTEFLKADLAEGDVLAFDGRCVSAVAGMGYRKIAEKKGASVRMDFDPAETIWKDRPALASHPVYLIPDELAGASASEKLAKVREKMRDAGAETLLLSRLDDICWLFNMRGDDVCCNPVALTYAVIGLDTADLFIQASERTEEFDACAEKLGLTLHEYNDIADFLKTAPVAAPIMAERKSVSALLWSLAGERGKLIDRPSPTELMKACKNPVEIANMREVYLRDSAALTHFIRWFKTHVGREEITELSAAAKLDGMRAALPGFIELSFPTISAYGPNAAMAHYAATEESNATVCDHGFLLVDSGGTYMGGTTDVTRTMAAGPLTDEEKRDFTLALISNLNLLNARFLYGTGGVFLDACARQPLWDLGINYNHGTGHGIGYILNVHEGPQSIRWKCGPGQTDTPFEPGMVVSDEPGVYIEGRYGIRHETILLTVERETNEYGRWLAFEPLTLAPIDLDAVDTSWMQPRDIERLNSYHALVFGKLAPFFEGEALEWLKEATRSI